MSHQIEVSVSGIITLTDEQWDEAMSYVLQLPETRRGRKRTIESILREETGIWWRQFEDVAECVDVIVIDTEDDDELAGASSGEQA